MPQQVNVEGVGTVSFPDDATPEEIQTALNERYPAQQEKTSALGAAGRAAATGLAPGAAFMAGFTPGASVGAEIGAFGGPLDWATVPLGAGLGGLVTGGLAAYAANKAQRAGLKAIAPETSQRLEQLEQADVQQHPWAQAAGSVASLAPTAKLAPFKLATLPFRAAMGAGLGVAQPVITQGKLPTAPELAEATAMGTIFGEPRFSLLPRGRLAAIAAAKAAATQPEKGAPDAVQERSTAAIPLGQAPGDRQAVEQGVSAPEAPAQAQAPIQAGSEGLLLGQKPTFSQRVEARAAAQEAMQGRAARIPALQARAEQLVKQHAESNPERQVAIEPIPHPRQPEPGSVELEGTEGELKPPAEGDPFANRQVAVADHANNRIVVDPEALNESMRILEPLGPKAQEDWFKQVMEHENIHLRTKREDAGRYWNTLSAIEKAIERKLYTGRFGAEGAPSDALMGFEATRRRITRLGNMKTDEVLQAVGKEKWTLQSLEAINDTIRNIREGLGTSASKEGLAILDRVQKNIDFAKKVASGAIKPPKEADPAAVAKEIGFTFNPAKQIGGISTEGMPQEMLDKFAAAGRRPDWEFTDRRQGSPTEGVTFYVPEGSSREAILERLKEHREARGMPGARMPRRKEIGQEAFKLPFVPRGTDVERAVNIEIPPPKVTGLKITPVDIDWAQPGKQGAYRPISDAEAANPKALGEILTSDARIGGSTLPASSSRRLVTLLDRRNGKVHIVSVYPESRSGARAVDPAAPSKARPTKPIGDLLARYKPIYSILRDSPVKNFHQEFSGLDEYQARFGEEAGQRSQESVSEPATAAPYGRMRGTLRQSAEAEFRGGGKQALIEQPTEVQEGVPSTADLKAFHDFFEGEIPETKHDFDRALSQAGAKGTRQMANAAYQAFLAEEKANPQASHEENVESALAKLYEDLKKTDTRSGFIEAASQRFGEGMARPLQEGGMAIARQVAQPGVLRELTTPERGPIPTAGARDVGEQTFPPPQKEQGLSPEAQRFVAGQAESHFPTLGRGFASPTIGAPAAPPRGAAPLGPGWPLREAARGPRLPTGTLPEGYKQARGTLKLEGEKPGAMMPKDFRNLQDVKKTAEQMVRENPDFPMVVIKHPGQDHYNITFLSRVDLYKPEWVVHKALGGWDEKEYLRKSVQDAQASIAHLQQKSSEIALQAGKSVEVDAQLSKYAKIIASREQDIAKYEEMLGRGGEEQSFPAAFMPRVRAEAKDLQERAGEVWRLMASRKAVTGDVAVILDSADHTGGNLSNQVEQRIRLNTIQRPTGLAARWASAWNRGNEQVLHAANAMVEAGFNRAELPNFLAKIAAGRVKAQAMATGPTLRERQIGKGWLRDLDASEAEVRYAQAHWDDPELQNTARDAAEALADIIRQEKAAGIDVKKQPSYLSHRYVDIWRSFDTLFNQGIIGKRYREARNFKSHYDALEAGPFMRVTHDIASLASHRYLQGQRAILREQWKDSLLGMSIGNKALAIRIKQGPSGALISPDPSYERLGNTGLAVLKDYHSGLNNLFAENVLKNLTPTRNLLYFTQAIKHTLLVGDFFHLGRMLYYGAAIMGKDIGFQAGRSVLDIAERDMPEAVRKGLITQRDVDWANAPVPYKGRTITRRELIEKFYKESGANLGTVQDALYKDLITNLTPMAGPLRRGLQAAIDPSVGRYNRFLFDNLTRGFMSESVAREYERQHALLEKRGVAFNPDDLMRDIAKDVNNFYGNIGRQGLLKAEWQQDLARMMFLAPQWVEGLIRKEMSATSRLTGLSKATGARAGLTGLGTTGMAIGRGLVFLAGLTQAINLITRRQFTWQNEEEGHKLDAWIPGRGADSNGFWLSPLAIYNELTHDLYRLSETKPTFADVLTQIAGNKEQPITRAAMILATGKTPTGETTTTSGERVAEAAKAATPVPITFGRYAQAAGHALAPAMVPAVQKGAIQRQFFGTFGVKIEPAASAIGNMTQLAKRFMKQEGLEKATGWMEVQTTEASYSKLRNALRDDDAARAAKVMAELRAKNHTDNDIVRSMKSWAQKGFTGSKQTERLFIASLNDKQLEQYSQALDERLATLEKFYSFYTQQP